MRHTTIFSRCDGSYIYAGARFGSYKEKSYNKKQICETHRMFPLSVLWAKVRLPHTQGDILREMIHQEVNRL